MNGHLKLELCNVLEKWINWVIWEIEKQEGKLVICDKVFMNIEKMHILEHVELIENEIEENG